jgi:hypothetical protein
MVGIADYRRARNRRGNRMADLEKQAGLLRRRV